MLVLGKYFTSSFLILNNTVILITLFHAGAFTIHV
jgi:hypothetical protein